MLKNDASVIGLKNNDSKDLLCAAQISATSSLQTVIDTENRQLQEFPLTKSDWFQFLSGKSPKNSESLIKSRSRDRIRN